MRRSTGARRDGEALGKNSSIASQRQHEDLRSRVAPATHRHGDGRRQSRVVNADRLLLFLREVTVRKNQDNNQNHFPEDIFHRTGGCDPDTLANLGPLRPLAGLGECEGVDPIPRPRARAARIYRCVSDMQPIDPQANGLNSFTACAITSHQHGGRRHHLPRSSRILAVGKGDGAGDAVPHNSARAGRSCPPPCETRR